MSKVGDRDDPKITDLELEGTVESINSKLLILHVKKLKQIALSKVTKLVRGRAKIGNQNFLTPIQCPVP